MANPILSSGIRNNLLALQKTSADQATIQNRLATGRRINPAGDIRLAEHVWVGEGALILKGVSIAADSIVGARSVVTRDVPPKSIVAGAPARVVRSGVSWRHDLI